MPKFLTAGSVAGLLGLGAALSIAFGKPALGAFLSDPSTATTVTAVATGLVALVAGVLKGVETK